MRLWGLGFLGRARSLGFSIEDCRALLALWEDDEEPGYMHIFTVLCPLEKLTEMLLDYRSTIGTAEQKDAVAQLMYDVGVAFEMDYDLKGSGAYSTDALTVLPKFFLYSDDIKAIERSEVASDSQWFDLARQQVDKGLPVAFSIYSEDSGHEVVIDGYRVSQGATTFHINMGWGGSYDGYYSLNNIDDYNMDEWQIFVYDIYPPGYLDVQPPQNTIGEVFLNASLFFSQYICRISWDASPSGEENLSKYAVLQKDSQGNVVVLGEVPPQAREYSFRSADYAAGMYAVVAVDQNGLLEAVENRLRGDASANIGGRRHGISFLLGNLSGPWDTAGRSPRRSGANRSHGGAGAVDRLLGRRGLAPAPEGGIAERGRRLENVEGQKSGFHRVTCATRPQSGGRGREPGTSPEKDAIS